MTRPSKRGFDGGLVATTNRVGLLWGVIAMIATSNLDAREDSIQPPSESVRPPQVLRFYDGETNGERCALLDEHGKLLVPPVLSAVGSFFDDGRGGFVAVAKLADPDEDLWGYIDGSGAWVVEPELDQAFQHADNGLARFEKDERWGFVNLEGREVIAPIYRQAGPFDEGLAPVKTEKGWAYVSESGEMLDVGPFDAAGPFSPTGLAQVMPLRSKKWGYIDRQGKMVIRARFDKALPFGGGDVAPAAIRKEVTAYGEGLGYERPAWGLIDNRGRWIFEPKFVQMYAFNKDGLAAYQDMPAGGPHSSGFVNSEGEIIFWHRYLSVPARCGLARLILDDTRFLGMDGEVAFETRYLWSSDFNADCHALALRGLGPEEGWGVLHPDGRFLRFGDDYREPWVGGHGRVVGLGQPGSLVPMIIRNSEVAFLDPEGERVASALWTQEGQIGLRNRAGREIWSSAANLSPLSRPVIRLTGDNGTEFVDPKVFDDLPAIVTRLEVAGSRDFYPVSDTYQERRSAYDLAALHEEYSDQELADMVRHGAIEVLASVHTRSALAGRFPFLWDSVRRRISDVFEALTQQLNRLYGESIPRDESGFLHQGDSNTQRVWRLGERRLILEQHHAWGDGDFDDHLWLAVVD